jgi:hypothetical protein
MPTEALLKDRAIDDLDLDYIRGLKARLHPSKSTEEHVQS